MQDRKEWVRCEGGPVKLKGKIYPNLVEFRRNCATCNEPFSIHVTQKIANGADSHSFGLKNCEKHRRNKSADEVAVGSPVYMANLVMKDELEGLYVQMAAMREENSALRQRLSVYELQPAMERVAKPLTKSFPWS